MRRTLASEQQPGIPDEPEVGDASPSGIDAPDVETVPGEGVDARSASRYCSVGEDTFQTLLATGCPHWQALGGVAAIHGADAIRPGWDTFRHAMGRDGGLWDAGVGFQYREVLDGIGAFAPVVANQFLSEVLVADVIRPWQRIRSHEDGMGEAFYFDRCAWLTSLPEGWAVSGDRIGLDLTGTSITRLPQGFQCSGTLNLSGTPLEQLPEGMKLGWSLILTDCPQWDGIIPEDLDLDWIVTDAWPDGIAVGDLRALLLRHPGARANTPLSVIEGEV